MHMSAWTISYMLWYKQITSLINAQCLLLSFHAQPVAPERICVCVWGGGGAHVQRHKRRKMFLSCPSSFLTLQVRLVVLASDFVMGSTVCVSTLFAVLLLTVPPCSSICKSWGHVPCPMRPSHCAQHKYSVWYVTYMSGIAYAYWNLRKKTIRENK